MADPVRFGCTHRFSREGMMVLLANAAKMAGSKDYIPCPSPGCPNVKVREKDLVAAEKARLKAEAALERDHGRVVVRYSLTNVLGGGHAPSSSGISTCGSWLVPSMRSARTPRP